MSDKFYNYSYNTKEFILQNGSIKASIEVLCKLVEDGIITFPYQKFFCDNPHILFENLRQSDLQCKNYNYKLYSYYPTYNSYLPARYRNTPTIVIGDNRLYYKADILSDYFIEEIRLNAKRYDQQLSILDSWKREDILRKIIHNLLYYDVISPKTLRSAIYHCIPETKIFNPTWARKVLQIVFNNDLKGKKWLDISAGWGDRLLAAISLNMSYRGYDPNINLEKGHTEMINMFGNSQHKVIYTPFETSNNEEEFYDVVFSSPPYFNVEEYVEGQIGQSIINYPNFEDWMVKFLFVSITKAWRSLKDGGYLILHLGDTKTVKICEAANIFIEDLMKDSVWQGIIGVQSQLGYPRPIWVWRKMKECTGDRKWYPQYVPYNFKISNQLSASRRTLANTYPALYQKYMQMIN